MTNKKLTALLIAGAVAGSYLLSFGKSSDATISASGNNTKTANTQLNSATSHASSNGLTSNVTNQPTSNNGGLVQSNSRAQAFSSNSTQSKELQRELVAQNSGANQQVTQDSNPGASLPPADPTAIQAFFNRHGNNVNGDLFLLKPSQENIVATNADSLRNILLTNGNQFFQSQQDDDLQKVKINADDLGNQYYTFQQTYKGVPVAGKVLVIRTDANHSVKTITGHFESKINLDTTPAMSGRDAIIQALYQQASPPTNTPVIHTKPALEIYVPETGTTTPRLAYKSLVEYSASDTSVHFEEVIVDANQGTLLDSTSQVYGALKREVYTAISAPCLDTSGQNIGQVLPGTARADTSTFDGQESAAYQFEASTYWFYNYMFSRDSYDNSGIRMRATVHVRFGSSSGTGCSGMNAFYLPQPYDQVAFGDGDGTLGLSQAPDAVAHEFTHGVTHYTSDLQYKNEAGALNEALSDIFGSGMEAWMDSGGNASGNPANGIQVSNKTWIICDVCASGMQRYMNNPTQDGRSYDYYPDRYQGTSDNGGVHTNSGIVNLAFYLLAEGGSHPRLGSSNGTVTGIGIEKALHIYYDANVQWLKSATNTSTAFKDARTLIAEAVQARYGKCSTEWKAFETSFDVVGIPGTWSCGTTQPSPAPAPTPAPTPTPVPSPAPSPVPVPGPFPSPIPVPGPYPTPVPSPVPWPSPTPIPSPVPVPWPSPTPVPSPAPVPWPSPTPIPSPVPVPWPSPIPVPGPYPTPVPVPSPYPWPVPGPLPVPYPGPVQLPSPYPGPVSSPYPAPVLSPTVTKVSPIGTTIRVPILRYPKF